MDTTRLLPIPVIFWTWIAVYAFQLCFHIYSLTLPVRNKKVANTLYQSVTPWMLLCLLFSYGLIVAWIFLYDRFQAFQYSSLCVLGALIFGLVGFVTIQRTVHMYSNDLERGSPTDLWLIRLFIQNGLGLFFSWCAILVFYLAALIMQRHLQLKNDIADYVFLGMLAGYIFIWFSVDMCCSVRTLTYVFTPYLIWAVVCVFVCVGRVSGVQLVFIVSVTITSLLGIVILIKIAVTIGHYRSHTKLRRLTDTLPGGSQLGGRSAVSSNDGLGGSSSIRTDGFDF